MESSSLQELEQIPGVGITIARDIGRTSRISNNLLLTCRLTTGAAKIDKKTVKRKTQIFT